MTQHQLETHKWFALGCWIRQFKAVVKCGEISVSIAQPFVVKWHQKNPRGADLSEWIELDDRALLDNEMEDIQRHAARTAAIVRTKWDRLQSETSGG